MSSATDTNMSNSEVINRSELVFALVGAAGTRLDKLSNELKKTLKQFGYETTEIRLSECLKNFDGWAGQDHTTVGERIPHLQEMGSAFRGRLQDGSALARVGMVEIRKERIKSFTRNPDKPESNRAYILRQLKHPEEVDLLRETYGPAFFLVAGHAPTDMRADELAHEMADLAGQSGKDYLYKPKALEIIHADEKQTDSFGQNTRDTYPRADFFANLALNWGEHSVSRFVELLFGHPFHTPLPDEYAMFQAHAASLRSSDDNRQVGAAIAQVNFGNKKKNANIIAVGMNEVARAGGGTYWQDDSEDARDQALENDRARAIKISVLAELLERIRDNGLLDASCSEEDSVDIARSLLQHIKGTQFLDLGEFSRPVHAEMAALIDAARRGVTVDGETMYVTTFPCHNCAKHIIASGIKQVVYLEPYPKSRAIDLFREEINSEVIGLEAINREKDLRVIFYPFSGVAPRQYQQLFSMSQRGAKKGKPLKEWEDNRQTLLPTYIPTSLPFAYIRAEREALEKLPTEHYKWDRETVCPAVN